VRAPEEIELSKGAGNRFEALEALCRCQLQLSTALTFVVSDDDLDWEFVFDSHFGHPTGSIQNRHMQASGMAADDEQF
jgi:hypothetical protein